MAVEVIICGGDGDMSMRIVESPFIGVTQDLVRQRSQSGNMEAAPDDHLVRMLKISEYLCRYLYPIRVLIRMVQQLEEDQLANGEIERAYSLFPI